jgi:hypothetical protein
MEIDMNVRASAFAIRAVAATSLLVAGSAVASAANYQAGQLKNCGSANSCTLNFPAPGGKLRIDYVSCKLETQPGSVAWDVRVFNGTHGIFLTPNRTDTGTGSVKGFSSSDQVKFFSGSGPYTIGVLTGSTVSNILLACTVVGAVN